MPRVPGMEVLRELSKDETPMSTILLTAAIQPIKVTYALQLGARGIVLKASPPELLLSCIRAVRDGEVWLSPEILTACARFIQQPGGNPGLTSREIEIISAIRAGHSNKEIGAILSISEETVKRHLSNIFAKLGVSSQLEPATLGCWTGVRRQVGNKSSWLFVVEGECQQHNHIPDNDPAIKDVHNPHQFTKTQRDKYGKYLAADHAPDGAEICGKPRYQGIHLECAYMKRRQGGHQVENLKNDESRFSVQEFQHPIFRPLCSY